MYTVSLDVRGGMPDNGRTLRFGKHNKQADNSVFQSFARKILYDGQSKNHGDRPVWAEYLSPKMGMAVDRQYIYVLGGVPLTLKQYKRQPHSTKGYHRLIHTFAKGLCVPPCGSTSGQKVNCSWPNPAAGPTLDVYAPSLSTYTLPDPITPYHTVPLDMAATMGNARDTRSQSNRMNVMDETAGGHLVVQAGADGVAERVFGITHCGTVFLIEPALRRTVVLQQIEDKYMHSYWRMEVGIALQRYDTPQQTVSNLFVSVSKAYFKRFNANEFRFGTGSSPVHEQVSGGHAMTSGVSQEVAHILKISVNDVLNSNRCHGFNLSASGTVTSPEWNGTRPLSKTTCVIARPMYQAIGAETIQYNAGSLLWYTADAGIQEQALDMALPCNPLQTILRESLDPWCKGSAEKQKQKQVCSAQAPKHLMLTEGLGQYPWSLHIYKKAHNKGLYKGSTKTTICAEPAKPTTRHSPQVCCSTKHIAWHGPPQERVQEAVLF